MNTTVTGRVEKEDSLTDCLENDFLSSSEDTAVGLDHSILQPHLLPIEVIGNPRGRGVLKRPFLEGYLCRHPELVCRHFDLPF